MSSKIATCSHCGSRNFKILNREVVDTVKAPTAKISAVCNSCKAEFSYSVATTWGKRRGILY